jgi:uncharacterized protein
MSGFNVLAKPTGPLCNLSCSYCFYLEKERLYPGSQPWAMSDEVLEAFIRQYIETQDAPVVSFVWQGGEPTLLGLDFFRRVVELQARYAGGKRIENALQTNALVLDEEWGEFLRHQRFLVGVSIDGPHALHDRYRVDRGGRPTHERVLRSVALLKRHRVELNTLTVLQRENVRHPLEVYRYLREIGSGFLQFIPVVERRAQGGRADGLTLVPPDEEGGAPVAEWSVDPEDYGTFLCAVFEEWVRKDVGRVFVQDFDVALESWMGREPSLCIHRTTCGEALAVEHNGDLYSCDHFVFPEHRLGNIVTSPLGALVRSEQQLRFGRAKGDLPECCVKCDVLFACRGGCPKQRFVAVAGERPRLHYLCAAYKRFYRHIDPYMGFMAAELRAGRPPANVTEWARRRGWNPASKTRPQRNSICGCGSGKRYKSCCGRRPSHP